MEPYKRISLENGLQIEFFDRSNRYFGDYHRVLIEVHLHFELPKDAGSDATFWRQVRALHGDRLDVRRFLERMAVPTADTGRVAEALAADFITHNRPYLERPSTLRSLAAAAMHPRQPLQSHAR